MTTKTQNLIDIVLGIRNKQYCNPIDEEKLESLKADLEKCEKFNDKFKDLLTQEQDGTFVLNEQSKDNSMKYLLIDIKLNAVGFKNITDLLAKYYDLEKNQRTKQDEENAKLIKKLKHDYNKFMDCPNKENNIKAYYILKLLEDSKNHE